MKKLTDLYEKMISEGSLEDDRGQRVILEELEKVEHAISKSKAKSLFFKKADNLKGLYIWGGVGCGKSMLMDLFVKNLLVSNRRVHFHAFMQEIHTSLHKARGLGKKDPLAVVANKLINDHYNADTIHGDLSQAERDDVMKRFRKRSLQMLVATDVAARGLDVNDLTHVINYNLPDDDEIYIHRSGRTGRAGKKGVSMVIIHGREIRRLKGIEKTSGIHFIKRKVPNGLDICKKRLYTLIDKIEKVNVDEDQIEPFLPYIYDKLNWLDREKLIKHFVSAEFNRYLSYYKHSKDINVVSFEKDNKKRPKRKRRRFFKSKNSNRKKKRNFRRKAN